MKKTIHYMVKKTMGYNCILVKNKKCLCINCTEALAKKQLQEKKARESRKARPKPKRKLVKYDTETGIKILTGEIRVLPKISEKTGQTLSSFEIWTKAEWESNLVIPRAIIRNYVDTIQMHGACFKFKANPTTRIQYTAFDFIMACLSKVPFEKRPEIIR